MCVGTGFGPTGPSNIYTKYLNIESSKLFRVFIKVWLDDEMTNFFLKVEYPFNFTKERAACEEQEVGAAVSGRVGGHEGSVVSFWFQVSQGGWMVQGMSRSDWCVLWLQQDKVK